MTRALQGCHGKHHEDLIEPSHRGRVRSRRSFRAVDAKCDLGGRGGGIERLSYTLAMSIKRGEGGYCSRQCIMLAIWAAEPPAAMKQRSTMSLFVCQCIAHKAKL